MKREIHRRAYFSGRPSKNSERVGQMLNHHKKTNLIQGLPSFESSHWKSYIINNVFS